MKAGAIADKIPIPIDQKVAAIWRAPCPIFDLLYGSHWSGAVWDHVLTDVGIYEAYGYTAERIAE